jgi:hypothetical protein
MQRYLTLASLLAPLGAFAQGNLCPAWSNPQMTGTLDISVLAEASGMAVSGDGSRLYVINDGARPLIHVVAPDGSAIESVQVTGFQPRDIEEIARGRCGTEECLYVGDVGDNVARRESVQIAIVPERDNFGAEIAPLRVVTARYPDGSHDAEAIAIDPAGDLWLLTKARFGLVAPAKIYRLSADALAADGVQVFEPKGEIPLPSLMGSLNGGRRVVTSMDIAPGGNRFVLLTYEGAVEISQPLGAALPAEWHEGLTHRPIETAPLIQAEAIAYTDDGKAIIYTTESIEASPALVVRQECR